MTIAEYMADVAAEMRRRSAAIRRDFATHRPSSGSNREDLVAKFLDDHLPDRFGVSTGLIISHDGMFSNEADLVVVDRMNNAPLYANSKKKLWPVEAVYGLIEVKSQLSPRDLEDAVLKFRRFKRLQRRFRVTQISQGIEDSLTILWSFESPDPRTLKANLVNSLATVPVEERPDFVVVPDKLVAMSGSYLELARLGHPNSQYRGNLLAKHGDELPPELQESVKVDDLGQNALLAWYVWFDSWLGQAGGRSTDPIAYLPEATIWGNRV